MSIRCQVTNKCVIAGNNVSHSHRKTRRTFKPNLHKKKYWVETLRRWVTLKVSRKGMKIIDKYGIDPVVQKIIARGDKV